MGYKGTKFIDRKIIDEEKLQDEKNKRRYKCSCGHTVYIDIRLKRQICSYCGHWVYPDDAKSIYTKNLISYMRKVYDRKTTKHN